MTCGWLARFSTAVVPLVLLLGCSESTRIRTSPPGASVYVNGQFVGVSPVSYEVKRGEWKDKNDYRIEMEGYEPHEGQLAVGPLPGRITGTVFTLGILAIFKRPVSFKDPQDFVLTPVLSAMPSTMAEPPTGPGGQRSVEERLRELKRVRDDGLITDKEYQRRQQEILNEL